MPGLVGFARVRLTPWVGPARSFFMDLLKSIRWALTCTLAFAFSGCIEFEEQTVHWRYLAEENVLLMTCRYGGIYGGEAKKGKKNAEKRPVPKLGDGEIKQLESVMLGGRAFFFNNWIFEFNRKQLEQGLREIGDALEIPKAQIMRLLLQETRVHNLGFYLDEKGRLCGAQTVRISRVKQAVGLANRLVADMLLEKVEDQLNQGDDSSREKKSVPGTSLSPVNLLKRLERVPFERLRLSGITRISGKYRINLVDPEKGSSVWVIEGRKSSGYELLSVNYLRGFARIRKNGQTATVHLQSRLVEVDKEGEGLSLETMKLWASAAQENHPFIRLNSSGIVFQVPIASREFEDFKKQAKLPGGIGITYAEDLLRLNLNQTSTKGGILHKKCFPGYLPNAVKHVRGKYGLRNRAEVEKEMQRFMRLP